MTSLTKVRRLTGASGLSLVMTLTLVVRAAKILGMTTVPLQVLAATSAQQRAHDTNSGLTVPCTGHSFKVH